VGPQNCKFYEIPEYKRPLEFMGSFMFGEILNFGDSLKGYCSGVTGL